MRICEIYTQQFRNLQKGALALGQGVNVILGNNAQGKTNLLEAMWLFCGAKSFRGAKEEDMLAFGAPYFCLQMQFEAQKRQQTAQILYKRQGGREVLLNDVKKRSLAELAGHFCAVVFSPTHLSLMKDGPAQRRKFLDAAICQLKPLYIKTIKDYHKALTQKNALLKDVWRHSDLLGHLDAWDQVLAALCAQIYAERTAYVQTLGQHAKAIYAGFSNKKEQLEIFYRSQDLEETMLGQNKQTLENAFYKAICQKRKEEIRLGCAQTGVQRDDLDILIGENSARQYASQGQQRSGVLSLKLAEAQNLYSQLGEMPVILLDDVLSELDKNRQAYILHSLKGAQVVITGCEELKDYADSQRFLVQNGAIQAL